MSHFHPVRMTRRGLLGTAVALSAVPFAASAQEATPVAETSSWPAYGANLNGDRVASGSTISIQNVSTLAEAWRVDLGGAVNGSPVIANGMVYIGSYTGVLQALDLGTGAVVWSYDTGAEVLEPNLQVDLGILGSAFVADAIVYVGDATATIHAVDSATGELIWKTKVDDQPAACIWSSPIVFEDLVYVGVASVSKEIGFRGNVVALNSSDGSLKWKSFTVPEGADGGSVFNVPAVDPQRGLLYLGTQNAYTENPAPYGDPTSVIAYDTRSGEAIWTFAAPPGGGETAPVDDFAFSASPNLTSVRFFGENRDVVAIGQKSGTFWVLDRDNGEMLWRTQIAPEGPLGGMEGSSAALPDRFIVPATNWPDPSGPASGLVVALDAANGKVLWTANQTAPAASPVAVANDLVFQAGLDGILHAYSLLDGGEPWSAELGASASAGIAIAGDTVVVSAATPAFAPFVVPGTFLIAFRTVT